MGQSLRLSIKRLNRAELKKLSRSIRRAWTCSCRKHSNKLQSEKWLGHRVQAILGTFCLLLRDSTLVQFPFAKYKIYLTFSTYFSCMLYVYCCRILKLKLFYSFTDSIISSARRIASLLSHSAFICFSIAS